SPRSHLVSPGLVSPGLTWSHLVSPGLVSPCPTWSGLTWSHLVWSHLVWSHLVSPGLTWSHLVSCPQVSRASGTKAAWASEKASLDQQVALERQLREDTTDRLEQEKAAIQSESQTQLDALHLRM
ncbi:hypothetical protein CRUP_003483, partial [Coryphaenoides rupestris]